MKNIRLAPRPLVFGDVAARPTAQFGAKALMQFLDGFIEAGLARKTMNQRVGILRCAFRHAVEEEIVPLSPLHALQASSSKRGHRP